MMTSKATAAPAAAAAAAAAAGSPAATAARHVVRLLTFNVWFEPVAMAQRMEAIGALITRWRPAVVGFQELTRESLALLRRQPWARYYDCSLDTAPPFSEAYFVGLFSALPVRAIETLPFATTGMGRELVVATVEVAPGGRRLAIATTHLESLPQNRRERLRQLHESFAWLGDKVRDEGLVGAVLMGDTNLLRRELVSGQREPLDYDDHGSPAELRLEVAKSGRARCRSCGETIAKGHVRVGRSARERLPMGRVVEVCLWHHVECVLADAAVPEADKRWVRAAEPGDRRVGIESDDEAEQHDDDDEGQRRRRQRQRGRDALPGRWRDLWLEVPGNTEENGYTYDGERNGMIRNRAYRSRFDRVYFLPGTTTTTTAAAVSTTTTRVGAGADATDDDDPTWPTEVLGDIRMVGTAPIADGVWPSDHFGLLTTLHLDSLLSSTPPTTPTPTASSVSGSKDAPIELD